MKELLVITSIKKTILYLDTIIINYPNKETILKNKIETTLYLILEQTYIANYNTIKTPYLYKVLVSIKMLDFYLKISLDKKIISYKKYINICTYLNEIVKMLYGWLKYEKSK
ncbi:MAG: four helix bundle protein [Bacilli bacterium]